ncbi:hypothetical protein GMORB2_6457 [Geosmithia morbida]|uniref:Uncharacterized protein n=1 Tax=Geosmithia morbida TaxID=1094350 RepID=A0A9P4YVA7_9HYPO|nr:uncharacterized protein GMORB2_6457 [Geosmithia morbida]KAF4123756.1 hypothetical protein GMORB2_6457 [Geosmithia morbida]
MPTGGVWVSPEGRETSILLRNSPEVFTCLANNLGGVNPNLALHDVYNLGDAGTPIGHGLNALLHAVVNGHPDRSSSVRADPVLSCPLEDATPQKPDGRGGLPYNSQELEEAHMRGGVARRRPELMSTAAITS